MRFLGKGPVGCLAPLRPRTPTREASSAARLAGIVEDNDLPAWSRQGAGS
jgi:hypothetical protein